MTRDEEPATVPDLVLERHLLGELPPAEADALLPRLGEDGVRQRLAALARSDEEIRRRHPAQRLAEQVRARLSARRPPASLPSAASRYWPLPAAVAVAASVVLIFGLRGRFPSPPDAASPAGETATDRIKGLKPALALYRKTADHSEALADGDRARAGDLIRVGYRAAGRRFGAILSLDGRGQVTVHLPRQGRQAAPLQPGGIVLLDHAFELDDAPRWERFFFVTAATPFDVASVVEDARQMAAGGAPPLTLRLPPSLEQSTFSLEKEARP